MKSDDAQPSAKSDSSPDTDARLTPEQRKERFNRREAAMYADLSSDSLLQMAPDQRYKSILAMSPQERLDLARERSEERRVGKECRL